MAKKKSKKKSVPVKEKPIEVVKTTPFWKKNWPAGIILFSLAFLLYFQSIPYGYVLDDTIVITDNQFTQKGFSGLWDILTTESFQGYFGGERKDLVQGNRYRPLSIMSFAVEHGLWGQKPEYSHFINILLYALTGLLLFRVLSMLFRNFKPKYWWLSIGFVASLIFIAHPLHSEAVANIKGRDEIMAFLLSILTLYYVLKYVEKPAIKYLVFTAISFFAGLMAKENAITFLAVIPFSIYFFYNKKTSLNKRTTMNNILITMIPLVISTVIYLALRFSTAGVPKFGVEITDLMNNPFLGMDASEKMATVFYTLLKYLGLLVWPDPLCHDYYPYAIPKMQWYNTGAWLSLLVHIVLVVIALLGLRKRSVTSYAIIYYLATLSIASNIVINLGTFMNERFVYMASLGMAIVMAYFLAEKLAKWKPNKGFVASALITAIIVGGFSTRTFLRVPDWENAMTLNRSAIRVSPNSARANCFMGTALFNKYKESTDRQERAALLDEAEIYVTKAVEIYPKYYNGNLMKTAVAAEKYRMSFDINPLLAKFREVMELRPDLPYLTEYLNYLNDRGGNENELINFYYDAGYNLLFKEKNNISWAIHYLQMATRIVPDNRAINLALSEAFKIYGDENASQSYLERANNSQ